MSFDVHHLLLLSSIMIYNLLNVDIGICPILQQPNNYMMLFTNGRNKAL